MCVFFWKLFVSKCQLILTTLMTVLFKRMKNHWPGKIN